MIRCSNLLVQFKGVCCQTCLPPLGTKPIDSAGAGAGAGPGAYGHRVVAARAAQQCLEAALKEDPKAGYIWANLAAAYSTLGNLGRASQCLEQVQV